MVCGHIKKVNLLDVRNYATALANAKLTAMHEQTGWCGDVMREYWDAALPALREEMAKMYTRS